MPSPALDGKLLRPLVAFMTVPVPLRPSLDQRFWFGALALEMVHEASLLHDDILDQAPERRGKPTMMVSAGVGPALVLGDHLLTSAYRAAAATESPRFLSTFIQSVERTVAGEIAQEKSQGRIVGEEEYRRTITGKSGELFRSAFALGPTLLGSPSPDAAGEMGVRMGRLYQMVDDFLDYCPNADRGKAPLQDYRQKKWTWPLDLLACADFDTPEEEILRRLFRPLEAWVPPPMERGAERIRSALEVLVQDMAREGLETQSVAVLLREWGDLVTEAANQEVEALRPGTHNLAAPIPGTRALLPFPAPPGPGTLRSRLLAEVRDLDDPRARLRYFGRHARSFRFASRLFPREVLQRIADIYAFCRFTDDMVDEPSTRDPAHLDARLKEWLGMAWDAYQGNITGSGLVDEVMGAMRDAGVRFDYVHALMEGVRMDLHPRRYGSMEELRQYSYRVASVVGGWITELFGIHDPWILERAFALGHAMQLTNILRDVGEDMRAGRLYLPEDRMKRHGIDRAFLEAKIANGSPVFPGYRALLNELMAAAESDYTKAFEGIPALPAPLRAPVAVAASLYRGILGEIRRNGFDNLHRRAVTSLPRKLLLAAAGVWTLREASRSHTLSQRMNDSILRNPPRRDEQGAIA